MVYDILIKNKMHCSLITNKHIVDSKIHPKIDFYLFSFLFDIK